MTLPSDTDNRQKVHSFLKFFFASFATRILTTAMRLLRNAVLARVLGPTARGVFALINALPELINAAGSFGYSSAIAYAAAQRRYPTSAILGCMFLFLAIIGSLITLITFGILHLDFIIKDQREVIIDYAPLIALAVPIFMFELFTASVLTARSSIIEVNVLRILDSSLPLIFFLLLWSGMGVLALKASVYAWFGGSVVVMLMGLWWLRKHDAYPPRLSRPLLKESVDYGMRSYLDDLFRVALHRIDFLFVASILGAEALGFYAMATAAAELLIAIPDSVNLPLLSILMGAKKNEREIATPLALKLVLVTMTISAVGMLLVGKFLIGLLFGHAFLPAYQPLVWLLPGVVGLSMWGILRLYMLGHSRPGTVSVMTGWSLLINVLLNLALIPTMGIVGAAISSSIGYITNAALLYRQYAKLSGNNPRQTFLLSANDVRWLSLEIRTWMKRAIT